MAAYNWLCIRLCTIDVHMAAWCRLARAAPHEDCLTKVLRLAANLAIHADAGPSLAGQRSVADALLHVLSRHSVARSEELVLNAVCALTNLSFYMHDGANGFTNQVSCPHMEVLFSGPNRCKAARRHAQAYLPTACYRKAEQQLLNIPSMKVQRRMLWYKVTCVIKGLLPCSCVGAGVGT